MNLRRRNGGDGDWDILKSIENSILYYIFDVMLIGCCCDSLTRDCENKNNGTVS